MSSVRSRLVAAGCVLALAGSLPAIAASASSHGCSFTDDANDAHAILVPPPVVLFSDPAMDLLGASATWNQAEETVDFVIEVAGLSILPPATAVGDYFAFKFQAGNDLLQVSAERSLDAPGERFRLRDADRAIIADIDGSYDIDNSRILLHLPAVIENDGTTLFALASGDVLQSFSTEAWRDYGAVINRIDESVAPGDCAETLGTVTPPAGEIDPSLLLLDEVGESGHLTGTAGIGAFGHCATCEPHQVVVRPTGAAVLTVALTAVDPDEISDLDVRVQGPGGYHQLTHEAGNGDTIEISLPADGSANGTYRITVVPFRAVAADYTVTASLS